MDSSTVFSPAAILLRSSISSSGGSMPDILMVATVWSTMYCCSGVSFIWRLLMVSYILSSFLAQNKKAGLRFIASQPLRVSSLFCSLCRSSFSLDVDDYLIVDGHIAYAQRPVQVGPVNGSAYGQTRRVGNLVVDGVLAVVAEL